MALGLFAAVGPQSVSAMLAVAAFATAGAVWLARPLLAPPDEGEDGGDGGGPAGPGDPPWWPDFERELRLYEERRLTELAR